MAGAGPGEEHRFESLKVTLRVSINPGGPEGRSLGEGRWHLDQVDLCAARQRESFVAAAAVETNLRPELLKRDLGKVLGKLEELQEARLRAQTAPKKPEPDLPFELLDKAGALLRDPRLWGRIGEHAALCGIAGERVNVLVGYLGAVSRLLDRPLAIIIQSSSAAGKTTLMDGTLAFVPLDARIKYSAMTGQSLFYMGGVDLRHKILAIVEEEGAEKASYALKPHSLDEELQNRCLVLTVDESREQTERIHAPAPDVHRGRARAQSAARRTARLAPRGAVAFKTAAGVQPLRGKTALPVEPVAHAPRSRKISALIKSRLIG